MPNTTVPANGGAMPAAKPNLTAIMRQAWAFYRNWHRVQESIHGPRAFDRAEFAFKLQIAWHDAKLAAMPSVERRKAEIREEIASLSYKPARINIEPIRQRLEAELSTLAA